MLMEVHHKVWDPSTRSRLRYDISIDRMSMNLASLMATPSADAPPPKPEAEEDSDWIDVWILCDSDMLLTSVHTDDADDLYDVWEAYNLDNRIGPAEDCRYGILSEMYDERTE